MFSCEAGSAPPGNGALAEVAVKKRVMGDMDTIYDVSIASPV